MEPLRDQFGTPIVPLAYAMYAAMQYRSAVLRPCIVRGIKFKDAKRMNDSVQVYGVDKGWPDKEGRVAWHLVGNGRSSNLMDTDRIIIVEKEDMPVEVLMLLEPLEEKIRTEHGL